MKHPRLMDPRTALYDLTCTDCKQPDGGDLSLSNGGCNLSRRAALVAIRRHRAKNPTQSMHWTAMSPVGGLE